MTAAELKAEVGGVERRYRGARYPDGVRERLVAFAREQRDAGVGWHRIGAAVGVRGETLRRWCSGRPSGRLVPVHVVGQPAVTLVSPTGWRVEGLSLTDAATLLRAL